MDARCVVVGIHPRITCSTIHHTVQVMGVPYRYTKEYIHPVVRDGDLRQEEFYRLVWYWDIDLIRDEKRKIFRRLDDMMEFHEVPLGEGRITSYSIADFYNHTTTLLAEDIYIWCKTPPTIRPYQK